MLRPVFKRCYYLSLRAATGWYLFEILPESANNTTDLIDFLACAKRACSNTKNPKKKQVCITRKVVVIRTKRMYEAQRHQKKIEAKRRKRQLQLTKKQQLTKNFLAKKKIKISH